MIKQHKLVAMTNLFQSSLLIGASNSVITPKIKESSFASSVGQAIFFFQLLILLIEIQGVENIT